MRTLLTLDGLLDAGGDGLLELSLGSGGTTAAGTRCGLGGGGVGSSVAPCVATEVAGVASKASVAAVDGGIAAPAAKTVEATEAMGQSQTTEAMGHSQTTESTESTESSKILGEKEQIANFHNFMDMLFRINMSWYQIGFCQMRI